MSPSLSSTVSSLSSPTSTTSSSSSVSLTKQRLEQLNLRNNNNNNNNSNNNNNTDDEESFLVPRPKPPSSHSSQGKSASHSSKPSRYSVPVFSPGSSKNGPEVTQDQVCQEQFLISFLGHLSCRTKIKLKVKNKSGLKTNMFFYTLFFCPILNSYQVSNLTKITNQCLLKV